MKHANYRVIKDIITLSDYFDSKGDLWSKEVRFISWDRKMPVIDIRYWNGDEYKDGIELTQNELKRFIKGVGKWIKNERTKQDESRKS